MLTNAIRVRSPDFSTAPHFQAFWVGVVNDSVATFVKTFQEEAVGAFCQYTLEQQVEQSEWEQFYGEKTVVPVRKARRWVEPGARLYGFMTFIKGTSDNLSGTQGSRRLFKLLWQHRHLQS